MNLNGKVIFDANGNYVRALGDGDILITAAQQRTSNEYNKMQKEIEKRKIRSKQQRGEDFIKQIVAEEYRGLLKGNNSGHALELAVRITYKKGPKGGFLVMSNINGRKPATYGDLRNIFGIHNGKPVDKKTVTNVVKKLEEIDFLWVTRSNDSTRKEGENYKGEIEENIYEINPKFFARGETQDLQHAKIYLKNFAEWTKDLKPGEKGFLIEIIPYFHYDQYVLCKNPHANKAEERLEIFDRTSLAKELGQNRDTVSDKVKRLKRCGILGEFDAFDVKSLYLHPDLVFKLDVGYENLDYTDKIRNQFEINMEEAKKQGKTYDLFDDLMD